MIEVDPPTQLTWKICRNTYGKIKIYDNQYRKEAKGKFIGKSRKGERRGEGKITIKH